MTVTWTEIETDLMSPAAPGTAITAAVNPDRAHLKLRPGRPIRIGVAHATLGNRWLYRGFIDAIEPSDKPDDWSTVTLRCIDALGEAGRARLASDVETGAGETTRTRATRILNAIKWPQTKRAISTSAIRPLYATELDGQVVDLLRQTGESEGGWMFGDNLGRIVLQHRDWLYHATDTPVDATIGNMSNLDVCPSGWLRAFDRADISTEVILDRDLPEGVGPFNPVIVSDPDAQVLYGIETYERLDLWTQNNADLFTIAARILSNRSARLSMPRIRAVTIDAATSDKAVDLLTTVSIWTPSLYRCRLSTDRGVVFAAQFFATGVRHELSASEWTAEISLDRSMPYRLLAPGDYIWDVARWDRSLWN